MDPKQFKAQFDEDGYVVLSDFIPLEMSYEIKCKLSAAAASG